MQLKFVIFLILFSGIIGSGFVADAAAIEEEPATEAAVAALETAQSAIEAATTAIETGETSVTGGKEIENFEINIKTEIIETQNVGTEEEPSDFLDTLMDEAITAAAAIISVVVVGAAATWFRRRGIPVTSEQEAMFKEIVTKRLKDLGKESWKGMREDPDAFTHWKDELEKGKIPQYFVDKLKEQSKNFAVQLKENREFRDFAKNLTDVAMDRLLKDLRSQFKEDYHKRMLDTIPKLASVAIDSAFDKKVKDIDIWAENAFKKLKPLLLSSDALDTKDNLMTVIKAGINQRLEKKMR